jgi:hypothetical protein
MGSRIAYQVIGDGGVDVLLRPRMSSQSICCGTNRGSSSSCRACRTSLAISGSTFEVPVVRTGSRRPRNGCWRVGWRTWSRSRAGWPLVLGAPAESAKDRAADRSSRTLRVVPHSTVTRSSDEFTHARLAHSTHGRSSAVVGFVPSRAHQLFGALDQSWLISHERRFGVRASRELCPSAGELRCAWNIEEDVLLLAVRRSCSGRSPLEREPVAECGSAALCARGSSYVTYDDAAEH